MTYHSDVSPTTLPVALTPDGIEVDYKDGRQTFYRGVPEKREGDLHTPPGKDTHVLVTDASETQGVLVYVNDRKTHDDILDASGVGRVLLELGEETTVFPGVAVTNTEHRVHVDVDFDSVDGRVFVFAEDEMQEFTFEIVPEGDA
jgi:hypothetical protein